MESKIQLQHKTFINKLNKSKSRQRETWDKNIVAYIQTQGKAGKNWTTHKGQHQTLTRGA